MKVIFEEDEIQALLNTLSKTDIDLLTMAAYEHGKILHDYISLAAERALNNTLEDFFTNCKMGLKKFALGQHLPEA